MHEIKKHSFIQLEKQAESRSQNLEKPNFKHFPITQIHLPKMNYTSPPKNHKIQPQKLDKTHL